MNASKEQCRSANKSLWDAAEKLDLLIPGDDNRNEVKRLLLRVQTFLDVAERKLPTEAAFTKDRVRRAKA